MFSCCAELQVAMACKFWVHLIQSLQASVGWRLMRQQNIPLRVCFSSAI